jgi:hypothetical protein
MHIETAIVTAPVALAAYIHQSGGLKAALLAPRRSTLRPLAYGLGALIAAEIGHHGGSWVDVVAHYGGGLMFCLAALEALAWVPRPQKA